MDTSSSQSKTSHLSSAMVTLYIHMGKLRNSFYEIKYTETFSALMTHKTSHNDDKGNFINSERIEVAKNFTRAYNIFLVRVCTLFAHQRCYQFPCTSIQGLYGSAYVGVVVKLSQD